MQLFAALICFALGGASVQAALYWDSNGPSDGAGAAPNGIWGASAFWNATADGTATSPAAWVAGEDAIFSAGTDGTEPFTVNINGTQSAGNLTVEEGTLTISGGVSLNLGGAVAGKGIIDIAAGLTTTIGTALAGGDDAGRITKSGDGTLLVNASCTQTGATMIAGGSLKLGGSDLLNTGSDLFMSNIVCVFDMNNFDQTIDGLFGAGTIINGGTLTFGQNNEAAAEFSGEIGSYFDYSPITLVKVGTGKQTLLGTSYYSGPTIVTAGVLAASDGDALGAIESPTIVSNGAALYLTRAATYSEPVILNGEGFAGTGGALRNIAGRGWNGGVILGSNTRINNDAGEQWNWGFSARIVGTDGENNFNVTFGGNGGTARLNISYPAVNVGTGTITKDGSSKLILDQPSICSAFYFNGGTIYPRNESQGAGFGSGKIYVGGKTCVLTADFMDVTLSYPIEVAAGANLGVNCNLYINAGISYDFTCNGVISGLGSLSKTNVGTLFLKAANTYTGNTTVQAGPLALGANGSISNSAVIDVWSGATFDVSAVTGGFVLGAAQTLKGTGTVAGNVTANGALAPEAVATFGNLSFNNDLTLGAGARLFLKVDRGGFPTSDMITVLGTLYTSAGAGTVVVTNVGAALQVGDSFTIFNAPVPNGQALAVVGGGVVWTNKLAVDGSIAVVSNSVPPVIQVPRMTSVTVGGPVSLKVTWTNAVIGSNYWLQYSTNLHTSNWTDLSPVTAWGTTASQLDGSPAGVRQRYYRVRLLAPGGTPPAAMPRITAVAKLGATTLTLNYTNTVAGTNYVVQYNTNLNTTNWTSLSPVTASGTTGSATDSIPAGAARRFYRVYGQF